MTGMALVKQWGALAQFPVLVLKRWAVVGFSGVPWWVLGALPPHTCTWRRHGELPGFSGSALVFINKLGAVAGHSPASGNLPDLDVPPW